MNKNFSEWYAELCSDVRWFEVTMMNHRGKNFKGAAEFVYAQLVADPVLANRSMIENRKHVYNRLINMPFEKVVPQLQQVVKEEPKEQEPIVPRGSPKYLEYLAQWQEAINNFPAIKERPNIDDPEVEGAERPKRKGSVYPSTDAREIYARQRHLEYVKRNYITVGTSYTKAPEWIEEDEFNKLYDEGLI